MTKRYSLCEQVLSGDIFDKYPTGIHDKDTSKVLRYPELIDILNEQDQRIQELENENRMLRVELDTHKHPLWSTREAERVVNELKKENERLKEENKELKPPKTNNVRIGLTLIKSCDDCVYSDLDGLDAVCKIFNAKHGGEYISRECPLPKWNTDFDSLISLMWTTNLTWGDVVKIVRGTKFCLNGLNIEKYEKCDDSHKKEVITDD